MKPDLILMDVVMPGLNGFQATRTLTRDEETRHIPVIVYFQGAGNRQDLGIASGCRRLCRQARQPGRVAQEDRRASLIPMARKTSLRDFQEYLSERLSGAAHGRGTSSWLGVQAGEENWLVDLSDSGEIVQALKLTPVPLTRPWFAGIANIRGSLYAVADFSVFRGGADAAEQQYAPAAGRQQVRGQRGIAGQSHARSEKARRLCRRVGGFGSAGLGCDTLF